MTAMLQLADTLVEEANGVPVSASKVIVTFSPEVKPEPVTVTAVPARPLVGLIVMAPAA
jgi:hypothetical protein